jgi:hypothetical protein
MLTYIAIIKIILRLNKKNKNIDIKHGRIDNNSFISFKVIHPKNLNQRTHTMDIK